MIVDRETIIEIRRYGRGCVVVRGDPPEVGSVHWVREPPLPKAPLPKPIAQVCVADRHEVDGGYELLLKPVKADFTRGRKEGPPRPPFRLAQDDRRRLIGGDYSPLIFEIRPELEEGDRYVLIWSRPTTLYDDESRKKIVVPREPRLWITITDIVKRASIGWAVRFTVEDRRHPVRYMARYADPGSPEPDITSDPTEAIDLVEAEETEADPTTLYDVEPPHQPPMFSSIGERLDTRLEACRARNLDIGGCLRRINREIERLEDALESSWAA